MSEPAPSSEAAPAWPTGREVRELLPIRNPRVTESQCDGFVEEWIGLVVEAGGGRDSPSFTAARIVRRGAWADAMEKLQSVSEIPVEENDIVDKTRDWAEKALKTYDAGAYSPQEGALEASAPRATVRNVTPEPLWGDGGFVP